MVYIIKNYEDIGKLPRLSNSVVYKLERDIYELEKNEHVNNSYVSRFSILTKESYRNKSSKELKRLFKEYEYDVEFEWENSFTITNWNDLGNLPSTNKYYIEVDKNYMCGRIKSKEDNSTVTYLNTHLFYNKEINNILKKFGWTNTEIKGDIKYE